MAVLSYFLLTTGFQLFQAELTQSSNITKRGSSLNPLHFTQQTFIEQRSKLIQQGQVGLTIIGYCFDGIERTTTHKNGQLAEQFCSFRRADRNSRRWHFAGSVDGQATRMPRPSKIPADLPRRADSRAGEEFNSSHG